MRHFSEVQKQRLDDADRNLREKRYLEAATKYMEYLVGSASYNKSKLKLKERWPYQGLHQALDGVIAGAQIKQNKTEADFFIGLKKYLEQLAEIR